MPIYTYECDCGHTEDQLVLFSSSRVKVCPKCNKRTFKRNLGKAIGKLYRPDADKIMSTMKYKRTIV